MAATITPKPLGVEFIGVENTTIYTTPSIIVAALISTLTVVNVTGTTRSFTLYLMRAGNPVGDKYAIVKNRNVLAGDTWTSGVTYVLGPGDSIVVIASMAGALTCRADGAEVA